MDPHKRPKPAGRRPAARGARPRAGARNRGEGGGQSRRDLKHAFALGNDQIFLVLGLAATRAGRSGGDRQDTRTSTQSRPDTRRRPDGTTVHTPIG